MGEPGAAHRDLWRDGVAVENDDAPVPGIAHFDLPFGAG
jgi:hypothetical protein